MDSVSATCTPMVSPVVSDSDDTADITTRDSAVDRISRYEVNFCWYSVFASLWNFMVYFVGSFWKIDFPFCFGKFHVS